jgi:hypothetical protein
MINATSEPLYDIGPIENNAPVRVSGKKQKGSIATTVRKVKTEEESRHNLERRFTEFSTSRVVISDSISLPPAVSNSCYYAPSLTQNIFEIPMTLHTDMCMSSNINNIIPPSLLYVIIWFIDARKKAPNNEQ